MKYFIQGSCSTMLICVSLLKGTFAGITVRLFAFVLSEAKGAVQCTNIQVINIKYNSIDKLFYFVSSTTISKAMYHSIKRGDKYIR